MKKSVNIEAYLESKGLNPKEMSHDEKYRAIVNAIGLKSCIRYVPVSKAQIQEALKTDPNLNNIPLKLWDEQHTRHGFISQFINIGINSLSMSNTVCALKTASRMWAEEEETK